MLLDLSKLSAVVAGLSLPEIILSTDLVMAGTGDRGGNVTPGLFPQKIVLKSPASEITSNSRTKVPFWLGRNALPEQQLCHTFLPKICR